MTPVDINRRLYHRPFKPFRIHMNDGSSIPIVTPAMLLVGETLAVLPVEMAKDANGYPYVKRRRTVALADIVEFTNMDELPV